MLELADDVAPTTLVGHSGEELGRLSVNEKTVGVLVGRVLSKVDVSGRVEAAVVAIRLGLTASDSPTATRRAGFPTGHRFRRL